MSKHIAILLLGTAALAGCATVSTLDAAKLYDLGEQLARSVCSGPPTRVTPVENPHEPGYIDRIESRSCSMGRSEIYIGELASDPQGLAMSVEISAPRAGLPPELQIGRPLKSALRVLGKPESRNDDMVTYSISPESASSLTISARAGRITSVQWLLSVD